MEGAWFYDWEIQDPCAVQEKDVERAGPSEGSNGIGLLIKLDMGYHMCGSRRKKTNGMELYDTKEEDLGAISTGLEDHYFWRFGLFGIFLGKRSITIFGATELLYSATAQAEATMGDESAAR